MAATFFFYDLETSGFKASSDRIMQFAGLRTDMELNPIGEPVNLLIKLTPDVLPSPDAIMVTGITPQTTLSDGLTEAEFLRHFYDEIVTPDTIFVGYNSVRFDDEFMRYLHYRNFYDAYEWQWKDGRSRWDLLDVVRLTRALRPGDISWPFTPEGKPTNRLESLTTANKLDHQQAHDALSDVYATIAIAKLIYDKQPELFNYLLGMRNKRQVAQLVEAGKPFVYTSGNYPVTTLHTTAAILIAKHTQQDAALVYDLCYDPTPFLKLTTEQLVEAWQRKRDDDAPRLPIKTIKYNRCPAVAPLGVISDADTQVRLALSLETIEHHRRILADHQAEFTKKISQAVQLMDQQRASTQDQSADTQLSVDGRLYNNFVNNTDKPIMAKVRQIAPEDLNTESVPLRDSRLKLLLPLYKARNYPATLSSQERAAWEDFCRQRLFDGGDDSRFAVFFKRLAELAKNEPTDSQQFLLEELQLYGQSILPSDDAAV